MPVRTSFDCLVVTSNGYLYTSRHVCPPKHRNSLSVLAACRTALEVKHLTTATRLPRSIRSFIHSKNKTSPLEVPEEKLATLRIQIVSERRTFPAHVLANDVHPESAEEKKKKRREDDANEQRGPETTVCCLQRGWTTHKGRNKKTVTVTRFDPFCF